MTAPQRPWPSWRYAWRLHRFRPRRQLANLAGVLLGWGSGLLPGIAAKIVFDRLEQGASTSSLRWLLWPFALLAMKSVATVVTAFTLQSTNGAFAFANAAMLQRNLLRRILELPGGRALPSSPGETVSRFRDDTEHAIWWPIEFNNVIGSAVTGTIAVVVMARINPLITFAVFLPIAVVVAVVEGARRRIVLYRRANQERTAALTGYIGDVFAAVQTVQVGNAEARVVEHLRELNAHRRRAAVRDRLLEEVLQGSFWIVNLGTGVVLIFAGRALQSGSFSVGDLALFVYYLRIFEEFTRDLGGGLASYRQLAVSFGRMHELLAGSPPETLVDDDEIFERGPLPPKTTPRVEVEPLDELRVHGLCYRHGPSGGGIDDVSLVLARGSFTVVTGRVGSGKSTLLQSILGLVPAVGAITWNGSVVADPATFLIPPRTAYTPQVPQLFSEMLEDNILLGHRGRPRRGDPPGRPRRRRPGSAGGAGDPHRLTRRAAVGRADPAHGRRSHVRPPARAARLRRPLQRARRRDRADAVGAGAPGRFPHRARRVAPTGRTASSGSGRGAPGRPRGRRRLARRPPRPVRGDAQALALRRRR